MEALAKNRSLTIENRHVIMENFFKNMFFRKWTKVMSKKTQLLYRLVIACFELEYYYSPLIIMAGEQVLKTPYFKNLDKMLTMFNVFKKIQEEDLSFFEVDDLVDGFRHLLREEPSYEWRYNPEEERLYTYQEMKAKREDVDLNYPILKYQPIIENEKNDQRVWHEHWVHLCMKRDMEKYMKKVRDLDADGRAYEIDFDNFNPKKWNENIKVVGRTMTDEGLEIMTTEENVEDLEKEYRKLPSSQVGRKDAFLNLALKSGSSIESIEAELNRLDEEN